MTYPTSMSGHTRTSRGTPKEKGKIDQYLLSEYSTHSNSNIKWKFRSTLVTFLILFRREATTKAKPLPSRQKKTHTIMKSNEAESTRNSSGHWSILLSILFFLCRVSVTEEEYLEQSHRDVKRQNGSDFKTNKQQDVINKCGTRTSRISEL